MSDEREFEDVCYYGIDQRVFVNRLGSGPTERQHAERLRELSASDLVIGFNWGYIGSGPNQVSKAVLADALGGQPPMFLYQAFTSDFVSQFPAEWRIRQGAVLRWVRGLLSGHHARHDFPEVLPPVDPYDKRFRRRRPEGT